MTQIEYLFTDVVVHRPVYLYRDSCGRLWMAHTGWSWFRVKYPHVELEEIRSELKTVITLKSKKGTVWTLI